MATSSPRHKPFNIEKFRRLASLDDRYERQLARLRSSGLGTSAIEKTVEETVPNLSSVDQASLVIYGEPQSGKTEMMICLTARLLDLGHSTVIHLMNDSVDLLTQNLRRFKESGLAPVPKTVFEISTDSGNLPSGLVIFCKKNVHDLKKLIGRLKSAKIGPLLVIDDEADYASPNSKINRGEVTKINAQIRSLLGQQGIYIGVTATPARLDLNNTFDNDSEKWVQFRPHDRYTGQEVFFPVKDEDIRYRRTLLDGQRGPQEATDALVRFIVSASYLNVYAHPDAEKNWTMLVHTSGKTADHRIDQQSLETAINALRNSRSTEFADIVRQVHDAARTLYPTVDPDRITEYVVRNASRSTTVVLNSERDRKALGDNAAVPTSPFTFIIGGNIISRGVTFPNLLSMFFTRNVANRLQQDTYIQRARMFGTRGEYLQHFELTIPSTLYADWRRCFVFHRLALKTIDSELGAPVWIGGRRVSVAAANSIDHRTVVLDKGEISWHMFELDQKLLEFIDESASPALSEISVLEELRTRVGEGALPKFLIDYIEAVAPFGKASLAIHPTSSIEGYRAKDVDKRNITRKRGFIGKSQLEGTKFPNAVHHVKVLYNAAGRARVFYKYTDSVQFIQNPSRRPPK